MAWYNAGAWDGLASANMRYAIHDLGLANQERRSLLGLSAYSHVDPLDERITGSVVSGIVSDLRTSIAAMLTSTNKFVQQSSPYTAWTLSSILADGSHGNSWVSADRPQDCRIWIQMRECFDRMTVVSWGPNSSAYISNSFNAEAYGQDADAETAWDNMRGAFFNTAWNTQESALGMFKDDVYHPPDDGKFDAFMRKGSFSVLGEIVGTILYGEITYKWRSNFSTVAIDIDTSLGHTIHIPARPVSEDTGTETRTISPSADLSQIDNWITTPLFPSMVDSPFVGGASLKEGSIGLDWFDQAATLSTCYSDVASLLTDQP